MSNWCGKVQYKDDSGGDENDGQGMKLISECISIVLV